MPSISNNFYIKLPAKGEKYDECRMVSTYTSINAKYVTKTEKRYYFYFRNGGYPLMSHKKYTKDIRFYKSLIIG